MLMFEKNISGNTCCLNILNIPVNLIRTLQQFVGLELRYWDINCDLKILYNSG